MPAETLPDTQGEPRDKQEQWLDVGLVLAAIKIAFSTRSDLQDPDRAIAIDTR
jgi:hypothetical protein